MFIVRIIHFLLWLAFVAGAGEVLVNLTNEMRGAAIKVHKHGPISHSLFTKQLTSK